MRQILVTGSRTWTDVKTIRWVLRQQWGSGDAVLVTGACRQGADALAEQIWRDWGGKIRRYPVHPAEWRRRGKAAGPDRNAAMVEAVANLATRTGDTAACFAFIADCSRGATNCAELATAAGIPTRIYRARAL